MGNAANPEGFQHSIMRTAGFVNVKMTTPQNGLQNAVRLIESDCIGMNIHAI